MTKRILVIDDDTGVRKTIRHILSRAGHNVEEAADGRQGVSLFDASAFDLVLTDLIMPEQEGIETILSIKRKRPEAKVIAISSGGRIGHVDLLRMAQHLGADAVLPKPFSAADLTTLVANALGTG